MLTTVFTSVACKNRAFNAVEQSSGTSGDSFSTKVSGIVKNYQQYFQSTKPTPEETKEKFCRGLAKDPEKVVLLKALGTSYAGACQSSNAQWFGVETAKAIYEASSKLYDASISLKFTENQKDEMRRSGNELTSWLEVLAKIQWDAPSKGIGEKIINLKKLACESNFPAQKSEFENLVCSPLCKASIKIFLTTKLWISFAN